MLKKFKEEDRKRSANKDLSEKKLRLELAVMQQKIKEQKLPVIILVDGWSASGKGGMISKIMSQLEPRGSTVYASKDAEGEQLRKPFLWRFWKDIPSKGELAIFDRGWYRDALSYMDELGDEREFYVESINTFERQLTDDGYIIIKFFLHISRDVQKKRMTELVGNTATDWRIKQNDIMQNRRYSYVFELRDRLLELTDKDNAPWHIIDNEDFDEGAHELLSILCEKLEEALEGKKLESEEKFKKPDIELLTMPSLSQVKQGKEMEKEEYDKALKFERKKLQQLHSLAYREKLPVIMAFEGWDASGKGGAIRRLSWSLDPRGHKVSSIAGPTSEELSKHYLWRFWTKIPKDGHIAIFDRSWYGRVMVERVEGFTSENRWSMAYDEINEFEKSLTDWGALVLKFFLHIDNDTQLERFKLRQETPEKQFKITDEDWRNREKWDDYETAIDEMLSRTSTTEAPWIIVEGNDKKSARLKVLRTVREHLEDRLYR